MDYSNSCIISIFVLVAILTGTSKGADCTGTTTIGENTPGTRSANGFPNVGTSLLIEHTDFMIPCTCGSINEWVYYAKSIGQIHMQVWRETAAGTAMFTLIGENNFTSTAVGINTETLTGPSRISVETGDYLGWYSPGTPIASYGNNGGGPTWRETTLIGAVSVGNTADWSPYAIGTGKRFGFHAKVQAGDAPTITNLARSLTISDATALAFLLYTLVVYDDNGDTLTTSMTTGSTDFAFDSTTLKVTLLTSSIVPTTYSLDFQTVDTCGKTGTGTLTTVVVNSTPLITSLPSYAYVSEKTTAQILLHTIAITDLSPSDSIVSCVLTAAPKFTTIIVSGNTYGIYSIATPNFVYATVKKYTLTVTCTDSYGDADSSTLYVYITPNYPPSFSNLPSSVTIPKSTPISTSIFQVGTSDPDPGDTVTFNALSCSSGTCPFTITNGQVDTNADLSTTTTVGYDILVSITDGTITSGPRVLSVTISGINSAPLIQNKPAGLTITVPENSAKSMSVYQTNAVDPDSDTLTYSIAYTPSVEGATVFSFNTATGLLTTSSTTFIDYETLTSKTFTVDSTVSDGTVTDTYQFTVNIADINEAPTFNSTVYYLTGNEGNPGESFGIPSFGVTDPDPGATTSYSIDCTTFAMDSTSGAVTLHIPYDLDATGSSSTVTCTATVSDGLLSDTAQIVSTVSDINDNTPKFGAVYYTFYTTIYNNIGDVIGSIAATDGDVGLYGTLTYTIDQSSLADIYFGVQGQGNIFLAKYISTFGTGATMTFTASVTDFGGLNDTATVTVVIYATTTLAVTSTTERYITFFEYPPNVAWFTLFMLCTALVTAVFGYLTYSHGFLKHVWDKIAEACKKKQRTANNEKGRTRRRQTPGLRKTVNFSSRNFRMQ